MLVVIHIVPHLPPQNSGVGDYATLVGRRMEEIGGMTCGYVAAGQNVVEQPADNERARNVTGRCESDALWHAVEELADSIEPSPSPSLRGRGNLAVVLHYSGYGYDSNGAPAWLADALRHRPRGRATHVLTYFHELYANGWPWQRAFWYSSRQRHIAVEIARLSDVLFTNREQSARWLEEQTGRLRGSVASLPVPSNVGEPDNLLIYDSRPMRAVTFGGTRFKNHALKRHARATSKMLRQLGITELVDIGAPTAIASDVFQREGIRVRQFGFLPLEEVSGYLAQSRVGLLDYPADYAAKSSIFAAFAAHGIVPLVLPGKQAAGDGLVLDIHFFYRNKTSTLDSAAVRAASVNAFQWYRQHDTVRHAEAQLAALNEQPVRYTAAAVER